jgi:hypothetical protein
MIPTMRPPPESMEALCSPYVLGSPLRIQLSAFLQYLDYAQNMARSDPEMLGQKNRQVRDDTDLDIILIKQTLP